MIRNYFFLGILILILTACSSPSKTPTSQGAESIKPDQPTNTSPPQEPIATPELIIFFDDFDGGLDSAWTWLNEDPNRWAITSEGWLAISAADPSVLASDQEIGQVNLLVQPAPEGDYIITTRLVSYPKENFQQAGIFLILDGINYVSILNAFCEVCLPNDAGYGVFMEAFKNGEPLENQIWGPHPPEIIDFYLRLVYSRDQNSVTGYYASSPDDWRKVGVIENLPNINQIGLGAANAPGSEGVENDLNAFFDYIEIARVETPVRTGSIPPQPTPTPESTATPTPTPLPEGVLFRDDFEGYLQPGWVWVNEELDRWRFTSDGWLEIIGANIAFYHEGGLGMTNFLTRELPEGEFMITAHINANPKENFQQAAIYIYQDQDNYIALNTGFCDICPPGGPGFFMETFIDNNPGADAYPVKRDPDATDVFLRLVNKGGSLIGYYATTEGEWQRVGAFGNFFEFKLVGLGTTNSKPGGVEEDIVSRFDYFEISLP